MVNFFTSNDSFFRIFNFSAHKKQSSSNSLFNLKQNLPSQDEFIDLTNHQIVNFSNELNTQEENNLNINEFKVPFETELTIENSPNLKARFLKTKNDGSCGIHAIFGTYNIQTGLIALENVQEKRIEIANWIEESFRSGNIQNSSPEQLIEQSLDEYIQTPEGSPSFIRTMINFIKTGEHDDGFHRIEKILSKASQEELNNKQLNSKNPLLREAYLLHIREVSSYLSYDEVHAIAEHYGKTLTVYAGTEEIFPMDLKDGNENISIYYAFDQTSFSAKLHFSRLLIADKNKIIKETPEQFQLEQFSNERHDESDLSYAQEISNSVNAIALDSILLQEKENENLEIPCPHPEEHFPYLEKIVPDPLNELVNECELVNEGDLPLTELEKNEIRGFFKDKTKVANLSLILWNYISLLWHNEKIPENLRVIIEKNQKYQDSLNSPLINRRVGPWIKEILLSEEWKNAYIDHLSTPKNWTTYDRDFIKLQRKLKQRKLSLEKLLFENKTKLKHISFIIRDYIVLLWHNEKIPENLRVIIEKNQKYQDSLKLPISQRSLSSIKEILLSEEWKNAYIDHLSIEKNWTTYDRNLIEIDRDLIEIFHKD